MNEGLIQNFLTTRKKFHDVHDFKSSHDITNVLKYGSKEQKLTGLKSSHVQPNHVNSAMKDKNESIRHMASVLSQREMNYNYRNLHESLIECLMEAITRDDLLPIHGYQYYSKNLNQYMWNVKHGIKTDFTKYDAFDDGIPVDEIENNDKEHIKSINKSLNKFPPLKTNTTVYSGLDRKPDVGIVHIPSFISSSLDKDVAKIYSGGAAEKHVLKIELPSNSHHGAYIGDHTPSEHVGMEDEKEFLLKSNHVLTIDKTPTIDDGVHIWNARIMTDKELADNKDNPEVQSHFRMKSLFQ